MTATTTKERPILFSAPMVRAILAGRKTQTRRVVKPQPPFDNLASANGNRYGCRSGGSGTGWIIYPDNPGTLFSKYDGTGEKITCPYGVPGVVLLVKESWSVLKKYDHLSPSKLPPAAWRSIHWAADGDKPRTHGRTRPGRFLPNARVRTRLEVVSSRPERVQEISEADAIAEGFVETFDSAGACHERTTARENFLTLFYDVNKRAPRGSNPWVWVVEFKRVEVARSC